MTKMAVPVLSPNLVPVWKILSIAFLLVLHLTLGFVAFLPGVSWFGGAVCEQSVSRCARRDLDELRHADYSFGSVTLWEPHLDHHFIGFPAVIEAIGPECEAGGDQPQGLCQDVLSWQWACDVLIRCAIASVPIWLMTIVVTACSASYPLALWYAPRLSLIHMLIVTISYTIALVGIGFTPNKPGNIYIFGAGMYLITFSVLISCFATIALAVIRSSRFVTKLARDVEMEQTMQHMHKEHYLNQSPLPTIQPSHENRMPVPHGVPVFPMTPPRAPRAPQQPSATIEITSVKDDDEDVEGVVDITEKV